MMNRGNLSFALILIVALMSLGCSEDGTDGPVAPKLGSQNGPCYDNFTCDLGLECALNGICVPAGNIIPDPTPDAGPTNPNPVPQCLDNTCTSNTDCVDCPNGKTLCKLSTGQCIQCDPVTGSPGCPNGQSCGPDAICVDDPGPQCLENACYSNEDCAACANGKNVCKLAENRCIQCDPVTGSPGCPNGQICDANALCVEDPGIPCLTDENGIPKIACTSNTDCKNCSPMHQICDMTDNTCKSCTPTNTNYCLNTDVCVNGSCEPKCPNSCIVDNDCFSCEGKAGDDGVTLKAPACHEHKCSECSDTYPCVSGEECVNGVCVPLCGIPGLVKGSCTADSDCLYCGGNLGGIINDQTWNCNFPINDPDHGTCGPPAEGCADLGNSVVVLPEPWNSYTNTCSNDSNCNGVAIQYNVGKLLRDLVGEEVFGVPIQDAIIDYNMNICAEVMINNSIDCGICVPCQVDSDCQPIPLDPLTFQIFGGNPLATIALQFLLTQLYGDGGAHNLYFFCQPVASGYGVCSPCSNPTQACGSSGGNNPPPTGNCAHGVCDEGGALHPSCGVCEKAVCDADGYCCTTSWDNICVNAVAEHCTISCDGGGSGTTTCSHGPCETGGALNPLCGTCVSQVCDQDPFCCNNNWDSLCVSKAEGTSACDTECGGGNPGDTCPSGQVENCNGGCTNASWLGDNICDPVLDCAAHDYDAGDCCSAGQVTDCLGGCTSSSWLGNGTCNSALDCASHDYDNGDCEEPTQCASNQVVNCNDGCSMASWVGDGACDTPLNCAAHNYDGGDCCPENKTKNCSGTCTYTSWLGDDFCDNVFDCASLNYDNGDCVTSGCEPGEFLCNNGECINEDWVCDGIGDCNSDEDEENCGLGGGCAANEYQCNNSECIPNAWLCDGDEDCNSGEDEELCI